MYVAAVNGSNAAEFDCAHLWWDPMAQAFVFYMLDHAGRLGARSHSDNAPHSLRSFEQLLSWARPYIDETDPDTLDALRAAEQDRRDDFTDADPGVKRLLSLLGPSLA